jgi:hypothetical protein
VGELSAITWDKANQQFVRIASVSVELERNAQTNAIDNEGIVTGPWKPVVYSAKAEEVRRWTGLTPTERQAYTQTQLELLFPFMYYDAQAFGDTMGAAATRFRAGLESSIRRLAQVEAQLQKSLTDKNTTQL